MVSVTSVPAPTVLAEGACTATGENADFWYKFEPGMNDRQKGGLFLFSLLRGLSQTMRGCRRAGVSCDVHPTSILALLGKSRGIAVGPVVYVPNSCRQDARPSCDRPHGAASCGPLT